MRRVFFRLGFFVSTLVLGCSAGAVYDSTFRIEIHPQPLERGKPGLVRVVAPLSAREVIGTVRVPGSPQLVFEKDEEKGYWYFYGTLPLSPWVRPGRYKVRATVYFDEGKPRYVEKEAEVR